ncbi:MAG: hypothetical protein ABI222_03890 [Opitutaceae bacterium]
MKKALTRISPVKAGVVLGVLYALLACIAVPFLMLAGAGVAAAARQSGTAIPMGFIFGMGALFLPVIYGVFGFLGGLIAAAVYNLVAKWTGGLEFTLNDVVEV